MSIQKGYTTAFKAAVVGVLIAALLALLGWAKYMSAHESGGVIVTAKGLDELGIRLEVPYGSRSLQHVLLVNDGPHHLLACDIVFEFVTRSGEAFPAHNIVYNPLPLKEEDPERRKAALTQEPGIAPRTKWLIELTGSPGLQRVEGALPPPTEGGSFETVRESEQYSRVNITVGGAIVETGQAYGPRAQEFLGHVREELLPEERK